MELSKMLTGGGDARKATDLLEDDHGKVKALFRSYREAKDEGDGRTKQRLFQEIDRELTIHSTVEEEIFYPAVRRTDEEAKDLVLESLEEHGVVKTLLAQLRGLRTSDETFDAKMTVLMEAVEHHADEEEDEMFPEAEKLGDGKLEALGSAIMARKEQLQAAPPTPSGASAARAASRRSSRARKGSAKKAAASRKATRRTRGTSRSSAAKGKKETARTR